jgi:hypothetical protein
MRSSKKRPDRAAAKLLELWRDYAVSLNEAQWLFGEPELKEQYRGAGHNEGLTASLKIFLRRDLLDSLARGKLLAIGVQVAPALGDGPELLPSFVFLQTEVDWDRSTVAAFGRTFQTVKVVDPRYSRKLDVARTIAGDALQKRLGRPPIGEELRAIVLELANRGELKGITRKQQEHRVRRLAQDRHPTRFPPPRPSKTKILEALKAEGF